MIATAAGMVTTIDRRKVRTGVVNKKDLRIMELVAVGRGVQEIMRILDVTEDHIYKVAKAAHFRRSGVGRGQLHIRIKMMKFATRYDLAKEKRSGPFVPGVRESRQNRRFTKWPDPD